MILVVEDNPQNRKLARTLLELEGHEVAEAGDAEAAEDAVRERRPDLVLLDIQLPGRDGLELVRRWRRDASTRDLKVVAMTAYAMRGDRDRFLAAGCDGYISKPIDPMRFPNQVQEYLAA